MGMQVFDFEHSVEQYTAVYEQQAKEPGVPSHTWALHSCAAHGDDSSWALNGHPSVLEPESQLLRVSPLPQKDGNLP